jgi:DNA-binding transcriptional LysR family regulator
MDLKTLYRLGIFHQVIEAGSFTAAAEKLGLSKSVISQHVTDLENQLGVRLLNRTTRSVSITEEGSLVFQGAGEMLDGVGAVLSNIEARRGTPAGEIRLTSSQNFASNYLVGCVARFCQLNPGISIDLIISDAILNMIEERFDIAFRVGWLEDSSLHAIKICSFEMVPCASPQYLKEHGPILKPHDVSHHPWISIAILPDVHRLQLSTPSGEACNVLVAPRFRTNSGFTARQLVMLGSGIGLLPDYAIQDDLASERLVRLLPEWHHRPGDISALYVHRTQMPPRVRFFLNFLKEDAANFFPGMRKPDPI